MKKDMTAPDAHLLTIGTVKSMLQVSRRTLLRWEKDGKIHPIRLVTGSPRRYKKEEIEKLINEGGTVNV